MYILIEHSRCSPRMHNAGRTGSVVGITASRKLALEHIVSGLEVQKLSDSTGSRSCAVTSESFSDDTITPVDQIFTVDTLNEVADDELRTLRKDLLPTVEALISERTASKAQMEERKQRASVSIEEAIARLDEYIDVSRRFLRSSSWGTYQSLEFYHHYGYLSAESKVHVNGVPCEVTYDTEKGWAVGNREAGLTPTADLPAFSADLTRSLNLQEEYPWEDFMLISDMPLDYIQREIETMYKDPYVDVLFRFPEITHMKTNSIHGRLEFGWDEESSIAPPADGKNVRFIKGPQHHAEEE
jgi:hypothetical protein